MTEATDYILGPVPEYDPQTQKICQHSEPQFDGTNWVLGFYVEDITPDEADQISSAAALAASLAGE